MTILGMTWLRGPCTTYSVMKELSSSESTYHRSRAGTAYSVMNRLISLGLIERVDGDLVKVTSEGEAVLRAWTGPKVPMMDVAHSADLLRLRCFFLEVLTPSDRVKFIDDSLISLREFEVRCTNLIPQNEAIGDYFGALATMCSVLETRARIQWLEQIRDLVVNPLPKESGWTETILSRLEQA
ncbi:MAG TPA: hypothetical protein PKA27_07505 [Fimbriimonadaceae bacterium]|nr:hypothetical protein [Fimbriimonadaceae bacterium]